MTGVEYKDTEGHALELVSVDQEGRCPQATMVMTFARQGEVAHAKD